METSFKLNLDGVEMEVSISHQKTQWSSKPPFDLSIRPLLTPFLLLNTATTSSALSHNMEDNIINSVLLAIVL